MKKSTILLFALIVSCRIQAQQTELVFATYAYSTNNRLQNLESLCNYLSVKTGFRIKPVSYPTVQALISAIRNDSVDFAMMNTSGYLVLQRNHPGKAKPLVNLDMGNDTSTRYGGCLVAARESGITTVRDLLQTGNRFTLALVSSSSTSGNLVPRLLLNEAGIASAEEKFTVQYAGTHQLATAAVISGRAQLGGCGCAEVDSARKNQQFDAKAIVIGSFNNIPLGPVVVHPSVKKATARAVLKHLLLTDQQDHAAFVKFCDGWTEFREAIRFKKVKDSDYNAFRKMFGNNQALWKLIE